MLSVFIGRARLHTPFMATESCVSPFDDVVMPHLAAARRLARWLVRNEHDADDVVQEACLRAFVYFRTFTGGSGRAWFMRIVRNTCYGWRKHGIAAVSDSFDEEQHGADTASRDPETLLLQSADVERIAAALDALPERFRTLLTLRELEGCSYLEISEATGVPMGTVMSGLSRARRAFRTALLEQLETDARTRHRTFPLVRDGADESLNQQGATQQ